MNKEEFRKWSKDFYHSAEWKRVRRKVIARDSSICKLCGKYIVSKINVHHVIHITPENCGDKSITLNKDNLICLHHECHNEIHGRGKFDSKNNNGPVIKEHDFDDREW